ncbi:hypothetical protein N1027_02700 [Herbiconiux sp. CPCC 205763]|uniref:Potassium transporter Trk n=1 Tax=Herbiconiux aconitum TaxID=2970913 RepID=A0ABT2GLD6_9MICO|nr:hypothetical protein [Herbiconiux aconitum]MCS5717037.1 hypothetical protein [Herbiconiux aconitum]
MSDHTDQPPAQRSEPGHTTESIGSVSVRRAPRYYRFMAVGFAVGLLVTIILTFGFPEQDDFNRLQVFGFVGVFLVALFVAIGAIVAIALDRASRKRARTVEAERIEEHEEHGPLEVADFVQITEEPAAPMPEESAAPMPAPTPTASADGGAATSTPEPEGPRDRD